jgi:hypothetical protein
MLFSFACGKVHSLELGTLFSYEQLGKYKNFISLITMLALLVKAGCFLFQSYLLDVANLRFQRLITVNLLFSPLCGFLLLIKLHNLMMLSPYFMPIYNFFAVLSIIAGFLFFILLDDIRKKMVYLNMSFFGLIMQVLVENGFGWNNNLSVLYVLIFFFNFLFFTIYLYQNREVLVSRMRGIGGIHTRSLKMILIQFVLLANIALTVICQISANLGNTKIIYEGIGIFCAMAIVLNHIYKTEVLYVHKNIRPNLEKFASFVLMFVMLGGESIYFKAYQWQNLIFIILFLIGIANKEIHKTITMYKKSYFYEGDVGRLICKYCIVIPVEYTSRLLWLTVDFLLAEKTISNFFLWIDRRLVSCFNIINVKGYMACLWLMILGVLLFVLAFYRGNLL